MPPTPVKPDARAMCEDIDEDVAVIVFIFILIIPPFSKTPMVTFLPSSLGPYSTSTGCPLTNGLVNLDLFTTTSSYGDGWIPRLANEVRLPHSP